MLRDHLLLLVAASLSCGLVWVGRVPDATVCQATSSDSFNSGDFATRWTNGAGYVAGVCQWNGGASVASASALHNTTCDNKPNLSVQNNTSTGSVEQYACVTIVSRTNANFIWPGMVLRAETAAATSNFNYSVNVVGSTNMWWREADNAAFLGLCSMGASPVDFGDKICTQIKGVGAATQFGAWRNPAGLDPDTWGPPNCCVDKTGTSMGGTACSSSTTDFTNPAKVKATGNFVGMRIQTGNVSSGTGFIVDDFVGGECAI